MTLTRRLLAGSLILVSVLVVAIVLIAGGRLKGSLADETREGLLQQARLIALRWTPDLGDVDEMADVAGEAIARRVTIIDTAGVVIGDSEADGAELRTRENHGTRPEVVQARAAGFGCDRRVSASVGDEEIYCAVRDPRGFVRVSIPTSTFRTIVQSAQLDVLRAGLIALVGAALLAVAFSRSVSRPVLELRDVARAIAAGDLERRPALSAPGEVGDLATALHRMAEQLAARLAAVEREEALMLAVIESLDEGIVAISARGEVLRVNASARRILGVNASPPFSIDHLPPERVLRDSLRQAMRGDSAESTETILNDRTLAITARPLADGGAVLAVMDLTERRRLETIRRDFVANVSHELKTPLTVISGFAETLGDASMPAEQRDQFLGKIHSNAARMQRIVDDLLDLSRYESGSWSPKLAESDVEAAVREVFAGVQAEATKKGLFLAVDIAPDARSVRADPTALRQVLTNLVENALRHTTAGQIAVSAERDVGQRGVWIAVSDTGTGIAAEHLPRIFERFYRVDPGRSRDAGGTGLGLAIVKHLVESHGGRVAAVSNVGRGTTIRALFPAS